MEKLTTKQVVEFLGVSRRQVMRWQAAGALRPVPRKPGAGRRGRGADTLFNTADVERLRQARSNAPCLDRRCVMGQAFPGARMDADLLARIGWAVKSRVKNRSLELIKSGRRRALSVNKNILVNPPADYASDVKQLCQNNPVGVMRYLIGVVFLANTRRQEFPPDHVAKAHKQVVLDLSGGELGKEAPMRASAVHQFLYAGADGDTESAFDSARRAASADVFDRGIITDRFVNSGVLKFMKWQHAGARALDYPPPNFSDIAWLFGVSREMVRRDAADFKPAVKWIKKFKALFGIELHLLPKAWQAQSVSVPVRPDLTCLNCGAPALVADSVVRCSVCAWRMTITELREIAVEKNQARVSKKEPVRGSPDG